ncbi:hypothetical protein Tco_0696113, partial [Tanacetum coccineum]
RPPWTKVKEDCRGWPFSFLSKWAAKSRGRFISRLSFSSAPASEGLLPSVFLPVLLPSLFGASSNPTTLSRYLQTMCDLVRRGGVASLVPRMAPLIVQIWARSGFDRIEEFFGYLRDCQELYTTFSTLAGKLRWRGRSWVFDLNKSNLCPSFIEGLTAKGLRPLRGGFPYS